MAIALADILDEQHVVLQLRARNRTEALEEIVHRLGKTEAVGDPARFLEQVLAREEASSTLAADGVAFPHARTELVTQITLGIGRSRAGIRWDETGARAHLIFVVAVPQQMVNDYLVILGMLARATSDPVRRQALLHAPSPAALLQTLREVPLL